MTTNYIMIQDDKGNSYLPFTSAELVKYKDIDIEKILNEYLNFKNNGGNISTISLLPIDNTEDMIKSSKNGISIDSKGVGVILQGYEKAFRPYTSLKNEISLGTENAPFKDVYVDKFIKGESKGYTTLSNGIILQWGRQIQSDANKLDVTATFARSFPNRLLNVTFSGIWNNSSDNYWVRGNTDYKTYFTARKNSSIRSIDEFYWLAIGY